MRTNDQIDEALDIADAMQLDDPSQSVQVQVFDADGRVLEDFTY